MSDILTLDQVHSHHRELVGGKGLGLAQLHKAGLPVPDAFCITTLVYNQSIQENETLKRQILNAYQRLGGGRVAVRSSATDEDGSVSSFAGQQDTILGVEGDQALIEAIEQCWQSLHSERAQVYRQQGGLQQQSLTMAVVVQRLINADVAGVLFTRDPLDASGQHMLIEASWGLGETVVSGQVMPDRFQIDRNGNEVRQRQIGTKSIQRTLDSLEPVPPPRQKIACLNDAQLAELAELGQKVERLFGEPRDIEWAYVQSDANDVDGQFYLLQARPITTSDAVIRQQVRREEIDRLRQLASSEGTVWSRYNLAESLPTPTPMTWAIIQRWTSGRGGMGMMYRDLGFKPSSALDDVGVYDLICGRPYCNLSREPLFYSGWLPYEHSFAKLKANPNKALYPQPVRNPAKAGVMFWLFLPFRLPLQLIGSIRQALRLSNISQTFAHQFREEIVPAYLKEIEQEENESLTSLSPVELLERLEYWIHHTLYDFSRESLKPSMLANLALGNVVRLLQPRLGAERAQRILGELTMDANHDTETDLALAWEKLHQGELSKVDFLKRFGHRGPQEMELSQPRWRELGQFQIGQSGQANLKEERPPIDLEQLADDAKLTGMHRTFLEQQVTALQTYLGLRETAKHHLMRGYAIIRRLLLELDQRWNLDGGIFFLLPEELPSVSTGTDVRELIQDRRRRREIALSLDVPMVLFSDDLEAIDRPTQVVEAEQLQGVPLSVGIAEAPALVLSEPMSDNLPDEAYILVCPSTDPAWVPLFRNAKGLIMETGGVLSHGAIVAREFGLPAVAGFPDVMKQITTGQRIQINGATGQVVFLSEQASSS